MSRFSDLSLDNTLFTSSLFLATMKTSPSGLPRLLTMLIVPGMSEICLSMSSLGLLLGKFAATKTCSESPSLEKSTWAVYSRIIPDSSILFTL